jgi:hypothetical protein
MPGLSVTDEPAVFETLAEEEHGDVNGDGTSSLEDEDLPRWAQRSAFPDGELPRTHTLLHYSSRCFPHPFSATYPPHQIEPNF